MAPPKKNKLNVMAYQSAAKDAASWALKKADGEMFTRADIQFDLMSAIFNDRTFQFTSPSDQRAVSFKELYVETLSKFSRAAKSTARQLDENPTWATNFCIASFLINIGRINTTVAFYPELRAYMRTYHPIPCLQEDDYCKTNLQDAPRIKTMLKSCQLPFEANNEPGSLPEIASRSALGFRPPTTVVNLIFELFNAEPYVSAKYFSEGFVLHDLFSPTTIPTKLRAYAFLWLMHHFLEDPSAVTDFEVETKIQAFQLARMEDIQPSSMIGDLNENIDLEEEIKWGKEMQTYRHDFLKKWRGEEGIGFVDDLASGRISTLGEEAELTKKQKIMVQNYAQTTEADDRSQAIAGAVNSQQLSDSNHTALLTGLGAPRSDATPGSGGKEALGSVVKPKTFMKTRLTHMERLQSALDAMVKYGGDSGLGEPEDGLSAVQLAWRRNQYDIEQGRDEAYDSDDPNGPVPFPDWKPKELQNRLLGFAFEVKKPEPNKVGEEKKDKVIRYIGLKKSINRSNQNNHKAQHDSTGGGDAGPGNRLQSLTAKNMTTSNTTNNNNNSQAGTPSNSSNSRPKKKRKAPSSNNVSLEGSFHGQINIAPSPVPSSAMTDNNSWQKKSTGGNGSNCQPSNSNSSSNKQQSHSVPVE